MAGVAQFTKAPVSVFVIRNPPAAKFAEPFLATIGRVTVAEVAVAFVIADPGETPVRRRLSEFQVGRMPLPVLKTKVPSAGCVPGSKADAGGATSRARARGMPIRAKRMTRMPPPIAGSPSVTVPSQQG